MDEQPGIPLEQEVTVKKDPIILLLLTILFGVLFDILFYGKALGVSYPIFTIAFYGIVLWYMRKDLSLRPDFGWYLTIPVLMLSFTILIYSNEVLLGLNFLAVPTLLILQTLLITKNTHYAWHDIGILQDILHGFFMRTFGNIPKPLSLLRKLIPHKKSQKNDNLKKVFIGLAIAAPLLLIIVSLLASADSIFEHFLGAIPELFENIKIGEILFHGILILSVWFLSFGYIWSLSEQRKESSGSSGNGVKRNIKILDPVVITTVLAAMDTIYLIFVFIQFSYLFGSLSTGLPNEFTYAEYARRGFFELVAVTMINFCILMGSLGFTKRNNKATDWLMRILNTLLVGCTLVMVFSAHFRMSLYEEAYGYTYLRMFTHIFMLFIFVLFLMALYRIWNEKFSLVKPYIIAFIVAFLFVNYMNVDVIIARNNVNRYYSAKEIDLDYLADLSYDAIPQIARLLESEDTLIVQKANAVLYQKKVHLTEKKPWQSFNLSEYRAKQFLMALDLKP